MPNKLVLLEIAYQTYVIGFGPAMIKKKKKPWPKLQLQVGSYKIENMKQTKGET